MQRQTFQVADGDFHRMLHLLHKTDNIDFLVKIFSTLDIYLTTKHTAYDQAIKCDALYYKLALVVKSNFPTKTFVALNLISALLYVDNKSGLTRKKALNIYAKNMIRISGCLTAMSDFFTKSMMHQDVWKALCRSLRETCDSNIPNQAHCSYLVPLCIQRCQRGNLDPVSVLLGLLSKNQGNVILFHESNGMSIFNGKSLQNPAFLQLLCIVVENTVPQYYKQILKASDLFDELSSYLIEYGVNSSMGQWISPIIASYRKVEECDINMEEEDEYIFKSQNNKLVQSSTNETKNNFNETTELLCNVFREAIGYQNQIGINMFGDNIFNKNYKHNTDMQSSYVDMYDKLPSIAELQRNNGVTLASHTKNIVKENPSEPRFRKSKYAIRSDQHADNEVQTCNSEVSFRQTYKRNAFERSMRNTNDETALYFKPPFVSTPKRNKRTIVRGVRREKTSISSQHSESRYYNICNKIVNRTQHIKQTLTQKILRNTSATNFWDIVNESCASLFNEFKSIFSTKNTTRNINDSSKEVSIFEENNSRTHAFTKKIIHRVAPVSNENFTKEFTLENSSFTSCNTCNDTVVIQHKFDNDILLQQSVKRLKIGINLYGCDFKKISRTMWPGKTYMTPNVLYNLYRKLIVKQ